MAGVNKVILIGNLGKDPEVRRTPNGTSVAAFSIATTEKFSDKSGNRQERTEWHNIVAWDRLADLAGQYLKKGRTVYIEGKLQTTSWEDKNGGGKKYKTEIVANQMQFLGGTGRDGGDQSGFGEAAPSFSQDDFAGSVPSAAASIDDDLPF